MPDHRRATLTDISGWREATLPDADQPEHGGELGELLTRVGDLPSRVRSLRVETRGWSDFELSRVAQDRAQGLLARRAARSADGAHRRTESRAIAWMELGADAWGHPGFDVQPVRYREEIEMTHPDGRVTRAVCARGGDAYWWDDDRSGAKVTDGRRLRSSLACGWVVGTRWTRARAQLEVIGTASVIGRPGVRVHVTPGPGVNRLAFPFHSGDAHELVVDATIGATLSVTSVVDGTPFRHEQVTEIELGADVAHELTAPPPDAEAVPPTSGVRDPHDIARATELTVLSPTWLPPGYTFQTGSADVRDEGPWATLIFSKDRREFVQLFESPAKPIDDDPYEWEHVQRDGRTVLITDAGDATGKRIAHTTLAGTRAVVYATLPAAELLDLAFSLEVVR